MARRPLAPLVAVATAATLLLAAAPPGRRPADRQPRTVRQEPQGGPRGARPVRRLSTTPTRCGGSTTSATGSPRSPHYTDFPFTFHLIDMPEPNAFALPGGQIFVTRGMLDLGLTDDMLAALLGHEAAHVVFGHFTSMQRRATLMNVLSQALLVGVIIGAAKGGGAHGDTPTGPYRSPEPYDNGAGRAGAGGGGDQPDRQRAAAAQLQPRARGPGRRRRPALGGGGRLQPHRHPGADGADAGAHSAVEDLRLLAHPPVLRRAGALGEGAWRVPAPVGAASRPTTSAPAPRRPWSPTSTSSRPPPR